MNMVNIKMKEDIGTIIIERESYIIGHLDFVICIGEGGERECKAKNMFNPGIEPGTVCVLGRRDNHYTN